MIPDDTADTDHLVRGRDDERPAAVLHRVDRAIVAARHGDAGERQARAWNVRPLSALGAGRIVTKKRRGAAAVIGTAIDAVSQIRSPTEAKAAT
jgi:hypothetical protein